MTAPICCIRGLRRRDFITLIGGAAVLWPLTARAQQSAMPVVGLLSSFSSNERNTAAFNQGLKELGFVDGQNVVIDYRYAEGHYDQLPGLAADLVRRHVVAIFATGGNGGQRWRPRPRPRQFQSSLKAAAVIRCKPVLSPASTGLAATSRASASPKPRSWRSDLNCFINLSQRPRQSACYSIRAIPTPICKFERCRTAQLPSDAKSPSQAPGPKTTLTPPS